MLCVPRKTVQILKCLRLYKPLLHTIFSVYFEMFTLNHYKMTLVFSAFMIPLCKHRFVYVHAQCLLI